MVYEDLEPSAIRLFNSIIEDMEINNIDSPKDFLDKNLISKISWVSKNKQEDVEVVDFTKLRTFLCDKGIVWYGKDLDENFKDFLEMSPMHDDIMMVRKFVKAVNQIKNWKYFKLFGTSKRVEQIPKESESPRARNRNRTKMVTKWILENHLKDRINKLIQSINFLPSKSLDDPNVFNSLLSSKVSSILQSIRERPTQPTQVSRPVPFPKNFPPAAVPQIAPFERGHNIARRTYVKEDDSLVTSLESMTENGGIKPRQSRLRASMRRKKFGITSSRADY